MAGAIVAACLTLYAVSRWLYYDRQHAKAMHAREAAQQEMAAMDALPSIDLAFLRPRDASIHLNSLPQEELALLERRRMKLVVGSSSRGL